jgi:hypothetical protein
MKLNDHEKALITFMRENPDWTIGTKASTKSPAVRHAEISKLRSLGLNMATVSNLLGISTRQCYRVLALHS